MPTQHEKLASFSEHLLDGYLGLRERWELLIPVLPGTVVGLPQYMAPGFRVLQRTLLFATVLDIANLLADGHDTTPSLLNLAKVLADENFRRHARNRYAEHARLPPPQGIADHKLRSALNRASRDRVSERAAEFDAKYVEFTESWEELQTTEAFARVSAARDRVVAHNEIHLVNGRYAPVDLAALGVTSEDLGVLVHRLQRLVDLSQQLLRSAGFDWSSAQPHYEAARRFWEAR